MAKIIIRKGKQCDLPQIQKLSDDLGKYEEVNGYDKCVKEWAFQDSVKKYYKNLLKTGFVAVADYNGILVGFLIGKIYNDDTYCMYKGKTAKLETMFVSENLRKKGLGTKLINAFMNYCNGQDVERVFVTAKQANRKAIDFYNMKGFELFEITLKKEMKQIRLLELPKYDEDFICLCDSCNCEDDLEESEDICECEECNQENEQQEESATLLNDTENAESEEENAESEEETEEESEQTNEVEEDGDLETIESEIEDEEKITETKVEEENAETSEAGEEETGLLLFPNAESEEETQEETEKASEDKAEETIAENADKAEETETETETETKAEENADKAEETENKETENTAENEDKGDKE